MLVGWTLLKGTSCWALLVAVVGTARVDLHRCLWCGSPMWAALAGSGALRTAAPSCFHLSGQSAPAPRDAEQFWVPCSILPLEGSTNRSPCQVAGDNSKVQDWLVQFIHSPLVQADTMGARMKVSHPLVLTWRQFSVVETEGPGLNPTSTSALSSQVALG